KLGINEPSIVHNGSAILSADGKIMSAFAYSLQKLSLIIDFCRKERLHFNVCTVNEIYVETAGYEEQYKRYFLNPIKVDNLLSLNEPIVKYSIYADESDIDHFLMQDWSNCE